MTDMRTITSRRPDTGPTRGDEGPPTPRAERAGAAAFRSPRRLSVVTGDGVHGVLRVADHLVRSGHRICAFTADVTDGVSVSEPTCTVTASRSEFERLVETLRGMSCVQSVGAW